MFFLSCIHNEPILTLVKFNTRPQFDGPKNVGKMGKLRNTKPIFVHKIKRLHEFAQYKADFHFVNTIDN